MDVRGQSCLVRLYYYRRFGGSMDLNLKALAALALSVVLFTGAFAETPIAITELLRDGHFYGLPAVADIPTQVLRFCVGDNEKMAERGADWNRTDAGNGLPTARLLWAVTDGTTYVVHFEFSGIGQSDLVVVVSSGDALENRLLWKLSGYRFSDFTFLVRALGALATDHEHSR